MMTPSTPFTPVAAFRPYAASTPIAPAQPDARVRDDVHAIAAMARDCVPIATEAAAVPLARARLGVAMRRPATFEPVAVRSDAYAAHTPPVAFKPAGARDVAKRPAIPFTTPAIAFRPERATIGHARATPAVGFAPESAVGVVPERGEPAPFAVEASPAVALARAAVKGDAKAMRALLRAVSPRVERVVRAVLGRANEDADDVTQQALLGFVQALPSFRGECEPVHFASRVAARTAIASARRRRALRSRHEDGVDLDTLAGDTGQPEPQATAERARRMELLRDVLAQIPVEQAETLTLRIMLGWSLAEVAETMGVPLNTVRSRLRLAKTALRAAIAADPAANEELSDER